MSVETRREWFMTHPTLGVAIFVSVMMAMGAPIVLIPAVASGSASAVPAALLSIALAWIGGNIYGNWLIRRMGASRDWRPSTPSEVDDSGARAERAAGRGHRLGAALHDPRFAGFCALSTAIAAMNALVGIEASIAGRLVRFVVTAVVLSTFFLLLTIATTRGSNAPRTGDEQARNAMFCLAVVFFVGSVLVFVGSVLVVALR